MTTTTLDLTTPEHVGGKPGRPSLNGDGTSPLIAFRVPASLREQVEQVALRDHTTVSALAREALATYLDSLSAELGAV